MDPVVASILSALLGAAIPLLLYFRKNKAEAELTELQKIKVVLDEVQEERDKSREYNKILEQKVDELKGVIATYNGKIREYESERKIIISELANVKDELTTKDKALEDAHLQIRQVEETYKLRLDRQSKRIKELAEQTNGAETTAQEAKISTDQLREDLKRTGQLPNIET